jgi:acetylornithine deacetylase/succinyl-diaminopimelate desuccinylase-like protein
VASLEAVAMVDQVPMHEDTARNCAGEPDMPSRDGAIARTLAYYDDATGFFRDLAVRVAVPTESQRTEQLPQLYRYLREQIEPELASLGYSCRIYDNPLEGCGPVLLAHRNENAALTVLTYGHGDVVRGQEGEWDSGRDPWALTFEGDRVYGRGVADNKGQHLAHQAAATAVLAERGRLGFNHKIIIEMGEENGSRGFRQLVQAHKVDFAADVYFSSDGPRTEIGRPNITLGNRGVINFDLVCALRAGGHHSGNWGGLLANPGILLAQAIACITDAKGRILVEGWSGRLIRNGANPA